MRAPSKHSGYICQYAGSEIWSVLLGSVMFVNLYIFCIVMFLLLFIAFFCETTKKRRLLTIYPTLMHIGAFVVSKRCGVDGD